MVNNMTQPISFQNPSKEIDKAYGEAETGAKRQITGKAKEQADVFTQTMAQYGGSALKTGAAQKQYADIYAKTNVDISNMLLQYNTEKQRMKLGAEQFLQNLAGQGILDSKTGNFLRSTFDMNLQLEDMRFQNLLKQQEMQTGQRQDEALMGGLGMLAGNFLFPGVGGVIGGMLGSMLGGK